MKTKKCKTVENPESISTFHSAGESEVDGRIMSALGILSSMLKTDDASFPYCWWCNELACRLFSAPIIVMCCYSAN